MIPYRDSHSYQLLLALMVQALRHKASLAMGTHKMEMSLLCEPNYRTAHRHYGLGPPLISAP